MNCTLIWWDPTSLFNFLPLHAASEYRADGKFLSQQYVSSYTLSLTVSTRARRSHHRSPSVPFTAIGQNLPAGASFTLHCVEPRCTWILDKEHESICRSASAYCRIIAEHKTTLSWSPPKKQAGLVSSRKSRIRKSPNTIRSE
jgi:hypothetical protein